MPRYQGLLTFNTLNKPPQILTENDNFNKNKTDENSQWQCGSITEAIKIESNWNLFHIFYGCRLAHFLQVMLVYIVDNSTQYCM